MTEALEQRMRGDALEGRARRLASELAALKTRTEGVAREGADLRAWMGRAQVGGGGQKI